MLRVETGYGSAAQPVEVRSLAPEIFRLSSDKWAIVNADGKLNSSVEPARRGQSLVIYATGLGQVSSQEGLDVTTNAVTVVIRGEAITPTFAGLTPGFVGLYQINTIIPASFPVGLRHTLAVRLAGAESSPAIVAIQ